MGETNSPSVAHVGYDISPLSRVDTVLLSTFYSDSVIVKTGDCMGRFDCI